MLGLPVATYTAALISNTAVPAWHDGYEFMPFIFVSSAATAASGLGLLGAPVSETDPLVALGVAAGLTELALSKVHEQKIGIVKEAYHEGKAKKYMKAAEVLAVGGSVLAALSGRSRLRRSAAGAMMLAGSALTRFGIFEAGISSTQDPKYTIVPQRERLDAAS
jgi:formate-dependent nitrite reductase membrane component NrfD